MQQDIKSPFISALAVIFKTSSIQKYNKNITACLAP